MNAWRIITGEYAPQQGGVADYVDRVARALLAAGDEVEVHVPGPWSPGSDGGPPVHVLPDRFGPRAVAALREAQRQRPALVLLQHSPFSYGARGLNVLFPHLLQTVPGRRVVMFHEVAYPREDGQPLRHALLARAQAHAARTLLRQADAVCTSTTAWVPLLRAFGWSRPVHALHIPSNLEPAAGASGERLLGQLRLGPGAVLLGHFGTYGPAVAGPLRAALPLLLRGDGRRHLLLLGRGAVAFRATLVEAHPGLAADVHAPGGESAEEVSAGLLACDLVLQPFADGVTTRRTSFMAALAHGRATCTNRGPLSEAFWPEVAGVSLARDDSATALAEAVEQALAGGRPSLEAAGRAARLAYEARFSLPQTVEKLRALGAEAAGA